MFSRVATTEWNVEKPAEKVGAEASRILKGTVLNFDDEQIKEALADLRADGTLATKTPEEIKAYIQRKKLVPKLKQFKDRASETLAGMKLIEPLRGKVASTVGYDEGAKASLTELLAAQGIGAPEPVVKEILKIVSARIRDAMLDDGFPDRDKYISDLVADLMADTVLKSFIK